MKIVSGFKFLPIISLLAIWSLTGCLSFEITTDPPGADITFDGEYLGKSPCTGYETMKHVTHVYTIVARMPGYHDAIVTFPNNQIIQAIPDTVHIPLKPIQQAAPGIPQEPAAPPEAVLRKRRAELVKQGKLVEPVTIPATAPPAGPDAPAITIGRVATVPARIPGGSLFDLEVEFSVKDPVMPDAPLPVKFSYRILQGSNVLLTSNPVWLSVVNGSSTVRTEKGLTSTTQKGEYSMEALIEYKDMTITQAVAFTVE